MKILLSCLIALVLTGCQATVTVVSRPEGAYITSLNGVVRGVAPVEFTYNLKDGEIPKDSQGCWIVQGATAQWASGAVKRYERFTLCGGRYGNYTMVMDRPMDAPNLQADLNYELQLKANRIAAMQAAAAWYLATRPAAPTVPTSSVQTYTFPNGRTMNCNSWGSTTTCN